MASHSITATHTGGSAFSSELNGHNITIDTSEKDRGPRPKALMLVSLAGCTGIDVTDILNKMRVEYSQLSINVEGFLTETDPKTYHTVNITYTIKVSKADQAKFQKAVNLSQEKYCGVSAMFKAFSVLNINIIFL